MSYQDNLVQSAINNYMLKNRASFESTKDTFLNNSFIYIDDDGEGLVALQTKTLWTNPSPNSAMSAQTLTLSESMANYDYIMIEYYFNVADCSNSNVFIFSIKNINYSSGFVNYFDLHFGSNGFRRYNIVANNQVAFETASYDNSSILNKILLPQKIIGIKLVNSQAEITNIYSTDETVIGRWIDGKKIYRKVFEFSNTLNLAPNDWTTFASTTNENQIINAIGISTNYQYSFPVAVVNESGDLKALSVRNTGIIELNKIVLEYTKTTD